jgi:hypothetical protein
LSTHGIRGPARKPEALSARIRAIERAIARWRPVSRGAGVKGAHAMMQPPIPDNQGTVWAIWRAWTGRGKLQDSQPSGGRRNVLGCVLVLALFLIAVAIVTFVLLSNATFWPTYPH